MGGSEGSAEISECGRQEIWIVIQQHCLMKIFPLGVQ